jgi:hypothetical protein
MRGIRSGTGGGRTCAGGILLIWKKGFLSPYHLDLSRKEGLKMPRKTYICDICGQIFTSKLKSLKHYKDDLAEHEKPYEETNIHKRLQQEIESIRWNRSLLEQSLTELKKWPHNTPKVPPCFALRDIEIDVWRGETEEIQTE